MDQKIQRAIRCLYAVVIIQVLNLFGSLYLSFPLYSDPDIGSLNGLSASKAIGFSVLIEMIIAVAAFLLVAKLKNKTVIGWLGAISIFLIASPSYALPFSIFGLISLFDQDVRTPFIKELDIKI